MGIVPPCDTIVSGRCEGSAGLLRASRGAQSGEIAVTLMRAVTGKTTYLFRGGAGRSPPHRASTDLGRPGTRMMDARRLLWERAQSNRAVAGSPSAVSGQSSHHSGRAPGPARRPPKRIPLIPGAEVR